MVFAERGRFRYNRIGAAKARPDHQGADETSTQSSGGLAGKRSQAGNTAVPAAWEPRVTETVADIVRAHRARTLSPVETVERTFARLAAHDDPALFISLREE